jgi:phosphoglycolate phosphatase
MRLVVFDLYGTLADTFEDIAQATNHALMAFGCPTMTTEAIKQRHVGRGARNLMARTLGAGKEAFADAAAVLWREYYESHPTDHTRFYPGAVELLEWLRARRADRDPQQQGGRADATNHKRDWSGRAR